MPRRTWSNCILFSLILSVLFTNGCTLKSRDNISSLDDELAQVIVDRNFTGDPSIGRELADINDPLAQLGMKLFFAKSLGLDMDTACATCHHPILGGGDALPLPIGTGATHHDVLGPDRMHSSGYFTVPRNSPTTFNTALWNRALFLDGRIESLVSSSRPEEDNDIAIRTPDSDFGIADPNSGSNLLEAQARFPVTSEPEMRGKEHEDIRQDTRTDSKNVRNHLAERLANRHGDNKELPYNNWLIEFQAAFKKQTTGPEELITYNNIAKAIAEYEESQLFINTPWKKYVQGDKKAISDSAKRGALIFFKDKELGGAHCASCHSGDFFTDEKYHVLCIPQVGLGKGDGPTKTEDFGRFRESQNPIDRYAFRTPSLLNVEVTGPYGHSGFYSTLREIIQHHLSPEKAVAQCDYSKIDKRILKADAERNTIKILEYLKAPENKGIHKMEDIHLTDEQVNDLVNFLLSLTDPCVKDRHCLAPWIPDESVPDPDGLRLYAVDGEGNRL